MVDKTYKRKYILKWVIFPILILLSSFFLGIGYAKMSDIELTISGIASLTPQERNIYNII